jgi:hypothetical protein
LTEERLTAVDSMIAGLAAESEKPADAGIDVPEDADTVTMPVDAGIVLAPDGQLALVEVSAPDPGF